MKIWIPILCAMLAGCATQPVKQLRLAAPPPIELAASSSWTASSSVPWLFAPPSGSGSTVTWSATDNTSTSPRTGTITVTVTQPGVIPSGGWAKEIGGIGPDSGYAVAVDASGNVFAAGYFSGSVDFGGGPLTSAGGVDLFLAKYTAAGNYVWAKRFGASGNEQVGTIALDAQGNIFLAGSFTGTGNFGGANIISAGQSDIFLAKYSPLGVPLWSAGFGSTSSDVATRIAVDSQGNLIVTGYFWGNVNFGGITLNSYFQSVDCFLAKYSSAGQLAWAKNFQNLGSSEYGRGLAVARNDDIILSGYALSDINLGEGMFQKCGFLGRFSTTGGILWSRACGTNNIGRISAMALDANGDIIIGGDFQGQTELGGGNKIVGTSTQSDLFMAKYSGVNGGFMWSKGITGNLDARITSVASDAQNNIVIAGSFRGVYNFGGQSLTTTGTWDTWDGFTAKYSSASVLNWAKNFGGTGSDYGNCVSLDGNGVPVVIGSYESASPVFDGKPLINSGSTDILIGKFQ